MKRTLRRLAATFGHRRAERELAEEIEAHLAMAAEENQKRGMSPGEARRQAGVAFGGIERARGSHRDARCLPALESLGRDFRFSLRTLRREWGFAAVAIVILALGIGANTAVFSVVDALWLQPLPFSQPQQLAWIANGRGVAGMSAQAFTVDGYEVYRRENHSFQNITAYMPFFGDSDYTLTGDGEPEPVSGVMAAGDFFQTLGVKPRLGRLNTAADAQKGSSAVALLSYGFWQRQFGADPAIVGKAITLNDAPVTVVGVMPASFDFGSIFDPGVNMDIFVPAVMDNMRHWGNTLALIGRLRPGVTVAQAQAEADSLVPRLHEQQPSAWYMDAATITGLKQHVSGELRRSLAVLWLAVGLILLIVCVNLANLLLARAAGRGQEFAVRLALGASRGRLARQLLAESLLLAAGGAGLGVLLAEAIVRGLAHQGSLALPLLSRASVNATALEWTVLIAVVTALAIGLLPALRLSASRGGPLQAALKDSGRGMSDSRQHGRLRAVLVVSEIALACVLLAGAGLLLRSFLHILDVNMGFEPSQAAVMHVTVYGGDDAARRGAAMQAMLEKVQQIPGVEAAGISDMLPLGRNRSWLLRAQGAVYPVGTDTSAFVFVVTPGYLRAMGIRLRAGRDISWRDDSHHESVVIINEAAARRYWPGQDPVGRMADMSGGKVRVIGVVDDVRETSLERHSGPEMYVPAMQDGPAGAQLVVRSRLPPPALGPEIMTVLRKLNPAQPAETLQPLHRLVSRVTSPRRFMVWLVGSFAGLGLILAALGIYGVISYGVTQRTQEMGIRMALGASPANVQALVMRSTLKLALAGIAVGAALSLVALALLTPLLYGVGAGDPLSYAVAIGLLLGVALLAGYLPARRASRIAPMSALREG